MKKPNKMVQRGFNEALKFIITWCEKPYRVADVAKKKAGEPYDSNGEVRTANELRDYLITRFKK